MTPLRAWFLVLGAALLVSPQAVAAPPDDAPPDPANDPLPDGAKVRYGITRHILRGNPDVALIPPLYTNFLAPTVAGGVRRYDLGTGKPLEKATKEEQLITAGAVVVSADGKRAAVSRPGHLTLVDATTGKLLQAVQPPEGVVIAGTPAASLSGDGSLVAYATRGRDNKGEVVVLDVAKNEVVARFETNMTAPIVPLLSRDGKTLVTHGPPLPIAKLAPPPGVPQPAPLAPPPPPNPDHLRTAQVWDVPNLKELFRARVTGMGGMVVSAAFTPDGSRLAVSCGDGPVDVYDVKAGKHTHTLLGRKGMGSRVAFAPDGSKIAAVAPDYRIQQWAGDGTPLGVTDPPPQMLVCSIASLEFVDNDRCLGCMTGAQFAIVWEAPTGRLVSPMSDHIAAIRSISIPNDLRDLYTSGNDARVNRWDFPTGQLSESIVLHPARLPGQPLVRPVVVISADGTRAASVRSPSEVFDMSVGADLFMVPPPSAAPAPHGVHFSVDGNKAITVSTPGGRRRTGGCAIWDMAAQRRLAELEIPASRMIPLAALSPSGNRLAVLTVSRSAATGNEVLLLTGYDLKTGKKLAEVEDPGALGDVTLAAASETTAVLTTSGGRLWPIDFENGKILPDIDKLPTRNEVAVHVAVAFSPDGKRLATGVVGDQLENYGLRVYDFPAGKRTHTFMGHLGPITALRFTPDSNSLATGAQDTSVLLWDLTKPVPVPMPAGVK